MIDFPLEFILQKTKDYFLTSSNDRWKPNMLSFTKLIYDTKWMGELLTNALIGIFHA